jgi:Helix-turn-helix domain
LSERHKILQNAKRLHDKLAKMALPMTPKEAAAVLKCDVRTIVNWCITKRLGVRVGDCWLVDISALVDSAAGNDRPDATG